jgi:N-acetylneuraminic acid mutarotase
MLSLNKFVSFMLLFFFISGTFTAAFHPTLASNVVEDSWDTMASMNQARGSLGVVAVDGKIYAIGGTLAPFAVRNSESDYVATNECYDPKTDTWITLKPMPTPREGFAIAAYAGKIYCIGGYSYNMSNQLRYNAVGVNEVYDVAMDNWSTKASLPVSAGRLQAHTVDGKIFVVDQLDGTLFMYNPDTDIWTEKASMPSWGQGLVSTVVNDKIILMGKFYYLSESKMSLTNERKFLIYNPKTDTWNEGKTGPEITASTSKAETTTGLYAPQKVYFFYGGQSNNVMLYDSVNDVWSPVTSRPNSSWSFDVAIVDDVFYVIGGFTDTDNNEPLAVVERYVPLGYQGDRPLTSTSAGSSEGAGFSLNNIIIGVIVLVLTVCIVVVGVLFYFKKRVKNSF